MLRCVPGMVGGSLTVLSVVLQSYAARPGGSGSRFSGGVYQGRATDLARKRVADAKTRMKQKQRRMGDKILSQRVGDCVFLMLALCVLVCVYVCGMQTASASVGLSVVVCVFEQIHDLVPESRAYMDLLAFEQKLDATIMRKRLEIQERVTKPIKVSRSREYARTVF